MFCTQCGKPIEPGARFCSACGAFFTPHAFDSQPYAPAPRVRFGGLTRPRHPRVIAGVCSGLAQHFGWDVLFPRLILVFMVLFFGTGVLAYLIAWIVIPEAPYSLPTPQYATQYGVQPGAQPGTQPVVRQGSQTSAQNGPGV